MTSSNDPSSPQAALNPQAIDALIQGMRAAAQAHVLPRFRNLAPGEVRSKNGPMDLVTLADIEAEEKLRLAVAEIWPEAAFVGEEGVAADPSLRDLVATAALSVIVDPVDGTWNFAKGLALFGMIVAVAQAGRTIWGGLYDPVFDDLIAASADGPAEMILADGTRRRLSTSTEAEPRRMGGYIPLYLLPRDQRERMAQLYPGFRRAQSLRCSCHEYRMVAQGHAEFALAASLHPWDHAAGALIVERAGGVARLLDGRPYRTGEREGVLLVAGSEPAWERLADLFGFLA